MTVASLSFKERTKDHGEIYGNHVRRRKFKIVQKFSVYMEEKEDDNLCTAGSLPR